MNTETFAAVPEPRRKRPIRTAINRVKYWIFLQVWCRHLYAPTMRLLHRLNLHYAPPSMFSPKYGKRDHWCEWCGLRGNTWTSDPNAPLVIHPDNSPKK